jgi:hypothetical protein
MPLSQIVSASIEDGAVAPVDLSSVAQYYGFKNRLINGGMGIWQRGTSTSTNGAYLADRWLVSTGSTITGSRSTDVPTGFQYSLSLSGTSFPQTAQRIESLNCLDLVGQTITISFWAKQTSGAGAGSLGALLYYPNTVDTYTGSVTQIGSGQTFTGTTGWVQYSYTVTSLPAQVVNGLQIVLYANTSGAATWLVTGIQLEKGVTATSFDYRPYGTELALCQRYYQTITGASNYSIPGYSQSTTVAYTGAVFYIVTPRAQPTVTLPAAGRTSGTISFTNNLGSYPTTTGTHTVVYGGNNLSSFNITGSSYSGFTAGTPAFMFFFDTTVPIKVDAEL